TTLSNQVVRDIPAVRGYSSMVVLVPGVTTNTNDVATGVVTTQFPIHGGRNNEGRMTIDGLNVGNPPGGNQPPGYTADVGNAQEVTFTTAGGGLGEQETAGLVMKHSENRRQLVPGIRVLQRQRPGPREQQLQLGACGAGTARSDPDQQDLRLQRR